MTPDPAARREAAHLARRGAPAGEWPFRDHRDMAEIMRDERNAAAPAIGGLSRECGDA